MLGVQTCRVFVPSLSSVFSGKLDWLKQSFFSVDMGRNALADGSMSHLSQVFDHSERDKVDTSPLWRPWGDETFQNNSKSAGGNRATNHTDTPSVD